jgi:peptide/nickel transport system substrate-binding protein
MGAGPFELVELKQDVVLKVRAKKEHYRKVPNVEFVDLHYIQEDATRMAMLQAGEADIIMILPSQIKPVQSNPGMRIVWAKYGNLRTLLFFATAKPGEPNPLLDIRVRKAVAYAIDTKTIAEKVFSGMAEPWGNIVAPYHAGYDPDLKPHPYDIEKAKKLLAEAGYPNGFDTVINNSSVYKLDAQAVQSSLSKAGIRAKLEMLEHGIWRKYLGARKLKSMGIHPTPWWNGRIHPATALSSTFGPGNKYTYTDDDEMGEAFKKLSVMIDEEEMTKQVGLLTKYYHEKMLRINLWAAHSPFAVGKRIKYFGMPPGRVYPVNFEHVTLN